jgi:hypothetical protein
MESRMNDTNRFGTCRLGLVALALALSLLASGHAGAQRVFATPEAAADALVDSLARHDNTELQVILGPDYRQLIPLDETSADDRTDFLAAWAKGHRVVRASDATATLQLQDGWTLPVPIVQRGGGWAFDPQAGRDEMRTRRIGRDELAAILSLQAYVDAQEEYAREDRNGDKVLEYAQKFSSSPGRQDGLIWAGAGGGPRSPLGPLFDTWNEKDGYHGYRFKILKAQGPSARGGARGYVSDGRMTNGFAAVAWPARYGETGVISFLVNHDGIVYQKNLGNGTDAIARAMNRFDPDASWMALPAP